MIVHVYKDDVEMKTVEVYSIGGGSILFKGDLAQDPVQVYQQNTMKEILDYVDVHGISLYDYVLENEGEDFDHFLSDILEAMFESVENGLKKEGVIQGKLKLKE